MPLDDARVLNKERTWQCNEA